MTHWTRRQQIAAVVLLALAVRLLLVLIATDNVDIQNYHRVADEIEKHGMAGLYVETPAIYPYPPVWVWAETLANWLAHTVGGTFTFWVRLPIILADVLIVGLLALWQTHEGQHTWLPAAFYYAVNPVSLLVSCFHGQFDAIPISFLLLAAYWLLIFDRTVATGWALAIAIAVKSFPVLFLPLFAASKPAWRQRLILVGLALGPLLLLLLPFAINSPTALLRELFGYRGAALLGFMVPLRTLYVPLFHASFPLETTAQLLSLSSYLFLGAYLAYCIWRWQRHSLLLLDIAAIFALFYVLYAGIAPQYTLWILPFLLLINLRLAALYTASATIALVGFYLYAVPNTLAFWGQAPHLITQILYGIGGSAWWLTSLIIFVWAMRVIVKAQSLTTPPASVSTFNRAM